MFFAETQNKILYAITGKIKIGNHWDIGKTGVLFILIESLCKLKDDDYLLSLKLMFKKRLVYAVL